MAKFINYQMVWNMLNGIGGCGAKPDTREDGWDQAINTAIDILENTPAADVQEVRHGKWELAGDGGVECSICKEAYDTFMLPRYYCPNCGARMDGEK